MIRHRRNSTTSSGSAVHQGIRAIAGVSLLLMPLQFLAQEEGPREVDIPNPMAVHTWFIIIAFGAFLAWCISYILDRQREAVAPKPQREALLQRKNQLLDRIAELEAQKETGAIPAARYEKEFRKARGHLSEVLGRLKRNPAGLDTTNTAEE